MVNACEAALKGLSRLKKSVPDTAAFENGQLVRRHFGAPPFALKGLHVSAAAACAYYRDVLRRARGEPLQYILGEWEFMSLPFYVTPDVLIPRPDTETLAEEAVRLLRGRPSPFVLDFCTGSGCLAVSVLHALPGARGAACDVSARALGVALANAERNGVSTRLMLAEYDVLSRAPLPAFMRDADLIMCNPPYIPTGEIDELDVEVCRYEPRIALDGGPDGLRFYRAVAALGRTALAPGGTLIFEHGLGQGGDVCDIMRQNGYKNIRALRDLAGIERCAAGER